MNSRNTSVSYTILKCIISLVFIAFSLVFFLIDEFMFAGIIDNHIFVISLIIGFSQLFLIFKSNRGNNRKYILIYSIVFILLISTFLLILPQYTYNHARNVIYADLTSKEKKIEWVDYNFKSFKSVAPIRFMINSGYIIVVKVDAKTNYYLFNPINGEYTNENRIFDNMKIK